MKITYDHIFKHYSALTMKILILPVFQASLILIPQTVICWQDNFPSNSIIDIHFTSLS